MLQSRAESLARANAIIAYVVCEKMRLLCANVAGEYKTLLSSGLMLVNISQK